MKKRKRLISILAGIMAAVMILTLLLSILPVRSYALSSSQIRTQINGLQNEKNKIRSQIAELKKQYEKNNDEIKDIVAKKNVIDQEIGLLHAEVNNINEQIGAFSLLIADKQDELDHAQDRYDTMNSDYKTRIRAMEEDGSLSYWEVLFKATSFSNLLDRINMVDEIAASDRRRLKELGEAADAVADAKEDLALEKAELEVTKAELDETQKELDAKREEADAVIKELIAKGEEIEGLKEELEGEDQMLLAQIAAMEKEYTAAKAAEYAAYMATYTTVPPATSAAGGGTTSAPVGSSNWLRPCSYVKVSSPFGPRTSPTAGASTYHQGIDLAGSAGSPIYASRTGRVTLATYSNSAGYYVSINHGDGYSSIYMHMTNYVVSAGQTVSAGQLIGYMGSTGISTGNHLHFGIALNGAYVNPASYLSF